MKTELEKLADRLIENGRAGIAIEHKILEWKLAESALKKPAEENVKVVKDRRVS